MSMRAAVTLLVIAACKSSTASQPAMEATAVSPPRVIPDAIEHSRARVDAPRTDAAEGVDAVVVDASRQDGDEPAGADAFQQVYTKYGELTIREAMTTRGISEQEAKLEFYSPGELIMQPVLGQASRTITVRELACALSAERAEALRGCFQH
jgi:hypothetical protein